MYSKSFSLMRVGELFFCSPIFRFYNFPRKHIGKLHIKIIGFLFARQMYATEQRQWLSENLLRLVSRVREIQIGHEDVGEEASSEYKKNPFFFDFIPFKCRMKLLKVVWTVATTTSTRQMMKNIYRSLHPSTIYVRWKMKCEGKMVEWFDLVGDG